MYSLARGVLEKVTEDSKGLWQVRVLKKTALKSSSENKKIATSIMNISFARNFHENYEGI